MLTEIEQQLVIEKELAIIEHERDLTDDALRRILDKIRICRALLGLPPDLSDTD